MVLPMKIQGSWGDQQLIESKHMDSKPLKDNAELWAKNGLSSCRDFLPFVGTPHQGPPG
jgi:hypothetical protein